MPTLLIRNASRVETFDDRDTRFDDASIFIRDGAIEAVGPSAEITGEPERIIDASGCLVMPGLINTHHHFYQMLTRAVPGTQNARLFEWLLALYPIWARLRPAALRSATAVACAELLLSGCTTVSDHTYLWPNGCSIDDQIDTARDIGMRFHAGRGSMSIGQSLGGLPPDECVENESAILRDTQRAIERHHDARRFAMTRVVVAPCSPFSVSENLMRESIALARSYGVHAHTHLAETFDEERYCLERFGCRPVEFAERLGWLGGDVWHAHVVHPSSAEIALLGATRTGIAHCATSNMRLGNGIAPVGALKGAGARVGLGVDGSASNDASNLLDEARHALLLARVAGGAGASNARDVLALATRGGAAVLGRDDVGALAPGMAADVVGFRLDTLPLAGAAVHDPLAALVFCRPAQVDFSVVAGRPLIERGAFVSLDVEQLIARHNELSRALVNAT